MQEASAYPSAQKNCPSQAFKQAFGQTPDKLRRQYAHVNANSRAAPPLHRTWLLWMVAFFVAMLCFHLSDTVAEPKPESEAWKISGSIYATSVQDVISAREGPPWDPKDIIKILLLHPVFWLLLVCAYPTSRQIQAIFFGTRGCGVSLG